MKPPRNSRSALRDNVHMWTDKIQHAEIIVGIPAYNAEETIGHVVSVVAEGLVMNSALRMLPGSSAYAGSQYEVQSGTHFEAAVGVSYAFN